MCVLHIRSVLYHLSPRSCICSVYRTVWRTFCCWFREMSKWQKSEVEHWNIRKTRFIPRHHNGIVHYIQSVHLKEREYTDCMCTDARHVHTLSLLLTDLCDLHCSTKRHHFPVHYPFMLVCGSICGFGPYTESVSVFSLYAHSFSCDKYLHCNDP